MSLPTLSPEEVNLINAINNYRRQNNVRTLQVSAALTRAAQWMSNDMATNNYLAHTDSLGRNTFQRLDVFGYPGRQGTPPTPVARGENVAAGFASGQATFEQWRDECDPNPAGRCTYAHRLIMLDPNYQVIGVARAFNPNSTFKYYWTADFGGFVDTTIPIPSTPTMSTVTVIPSAIMTPVPAQTAQIIPPPAPVAPAPVAPVQPKQTTRRRGTFRL